MCSRFLKSIYLYKMRRREYHAENENRELAGLHVARGNLIGAVQLLHTKYIQSLDMIEQDESQSLGCFLPKNYSLYILKIFSLILVLCMG